MIKTINVIALQGASGASMMGVIDLFGVANIIGERVNDSNEPLFRVRVVSEDGQSIDSWSGYSISVDASFKDINKDDILYIPALAMADKTQIKPMLQRHQQLLQWLGENGQQQSFIATHCSGSFLLAEAGLLDGKQATTAWWLHKYFSENYPLVELDVDAICTLADNILCGAATSSYQDVCLSIIEKFAGKHFARLVAKYMMVDNQRRSQTPYAILGLVDTDDKVVNKAENWIRKNLGKDFKIEEVAEAVAVSPRTLIRRFQAVLSESPQSFTQKLRIEKCKILLETTQMRFGEIVQRCGYNDESAFRRLFKRHCQLSPRDYRRRFNSAAAEA